MPSEIPRLRASRVDSVLRAGVAMGLIGGALWCALPVAFPSQRHAAADLLLTALRDRRQDVASTARQYVADFAGDPLGIWIAAEAAAQQGDHESAIEFYSALPSDAAQWEFQRELGLGQRYNAIGDLVRTERHLRRGWPQSLPPGSQQPTRPSAADLRACLGVPAPFSGADSTREVPRRRASRSVPFGAFLST